MTDPALLQLLREIRDGTATPEGLARAKALAAAELRLPEGIRQGVLEDQPAAEAAGLLELLDGGDSLLAELAEAVRQEAGVGPGVQVDDAWAGVGLALGQAVAAECGDIEVSTQVLAVLRAEAGGVFAEVPVADAVRALAGEADVGDDVMARLDGAWVSAMLDNELAPADRQVAVRRLLEATSARVEMTALADLGRDLRGAVAASAGDTPPLWEGVARAVGIADPNEVPGWEMVPLADAVRVEAGDVVVAEAVMATIRRQAVIEAIRLPDPQVEGRESAVSPSSGRPREVLPRFFIPGWGGFAIAAAAALVAVLLRQGWSPTELETVVPVGTEEIAFAMPDEIVIEDLSFADDVTVFQAEGDEGALIIWIDDEPDPADHEEAL